MTRFQVLELLNRAVRYEDLKEIIARSNGGTGNSSWWTRPFREALRTQLTRAARWRLVSRRFEKWGRNGRGNFGVYVYRITAKGKARLAWFRQTSEGGPPGRTPPRPGPPA
jgi:hypothetical protein